MIHLPIPRPSPAFRKWLKLHKCHCLGTLFYTGYELRHANEVAFITILLWIGVCEVIAFFHGE